MEYCKEVGNYTIASDHATFLVSTTNSKDDACSPSVIVSETIRS